MKNRDRQYITILRWMRNMPEIKTNTELIAYALIYGFSQTDGQYLICKQSYIAGWLNISRPKCNELLKRMESKGLIRKKLVRRHGSVKQYKYCCILPDDTSTQTLHDELPLSINASSQTLHAKNIYNNIHNDSDNNLLYISSSNKRENPFCNIPQQQYDFEQLEIELLNNQEYQQSD